MGHEETLQVHRGMQTLAGGQESFRNVAAAKMGSEGRDGISLGKEKTKTYSSRQQNPC